MGGPLLGWGDGLADISEDNLGHGFLFDPPSGEIEQCAGSSTLLRGQRHRAE